MIWFVVILALGLGVAAAVFFRKKTTKPTVEYASPLPSTGAEFPREFQAWVGIDGGLTEIAKVHWQTLLAPEISMINRPERISSHDLWFHAPEAYGLTWMGRTMFTSPSLIGDFAPSSIPNGLAKRTRLRNLNPNITLLISIGYLEGMDSYTDFPPDHEWWLRDAFGYRVTGWPYGPEPTYLFNVDLPAVRQHCADTARNAMASGVFDGVMLDNMRDEPSYVDLLRRVRAAIGNKILVVNCNYRICPNVCPLVDGIFMECGPNAPWAEVTAALDYNERHVRQPAYNCLEIAGARTDLKKMRATTCLMLTSSNGYALYADQVEGYASNHVHGWYDFWNIKLGKPVGSTILERGTRRREFEKGTVHFDPSIPDGFIEVKG